MALRMAQALKRQIREIICPTVDKHRLIALYTNVDAAKRYLRQTTTDKSFLDASILLYSAFTPAEGCIAFVGPNHYKLIKRDKSVISTGDKSFEVAVKGNLGMVDNTMMIIVPTSYLPQYTNYIITHPIACITG